MLKKRPYARIAITLPEEDLATADRLALIQDRSRSWIVAEAIRRYVAGMDDAPVPVGQVGSATVHRNGLDEAQTAALTGPGLGPSRLAQLTRDMAMSPEARVRAAEETLRVKERRDRSRAHRLVAFDQYEDFLDWKQARGLGR